MFVNRLPWWKTLCALIFIIYLIFTIYSAYVILYRDEQLSPQHGSSPLKTPIGHKLSSEISNFVGKSQPRALKINDRHVVHIWGKAAIGLYLWEHILGGSLDTPDNGLTYNGTISSDHIEFRFLTGPGVVQGHVPTDVKHLVLVVNGREEAKISFARAWLDYLEYLPNLEGVAVVMLGDEQCRNDWIVKYATGRGSKVRAVWLTYDTPLVDNVLFYQWPLGVATYRNFPRLDPSQVDVETPRSNLCNFIGTVYPDSSRTDLVRMLNGTNSCFLKLRYSWEPEETEESLVSYVTTLLDSDLTLSPVGLNSECYRIYEALSCGSVPVVEDVMTEGGECGGRTRTPYRLLKLHNAPVIYVKKWERKELRRLLERQKRLPNKVKSKMRLKALVWYHNFTAYLKKHFIKVIKNRLLML